MQTYTTGQGLMHTVLYGKRAAAAITWSTSASSPALSLTCSSRSLALNRRASRMVVCRFKLRQVSSLNICSVHGEISNLSAC